MVGSGARDTAEAEEDSDTVGLLADDGGSMGALGVERRSSSAAASGPTQKRAGQACGHPLGLAVLCSTEVWERFSYYGMRALLVLYLTKVVFARGVWRDVVGMGVVTALYGAPDDGADDEQRQRQVVAIASQIYGLYTAVVYMTPLAGGYLADRHFGQRRMVLAGGIIMAAGHAVMTFDSMVFVGLALIAVGNGAFKPNISTQIGRLYDGDAGTARRDAAFSIFYCGINLGAALAPLVTGSLRSAAGFGAGFAAAGVGMGVGLLCFVAGARYLPPDAFATPAASAARRQGPPVSAVVAAHKERVGAIAALAALNVVFWGVYEQQGDSLALFIDGRVARGGVPSEFFQSINPIFILAVTPAVNWVWWWQGRRGREPHQIDKMALGCGMLAASYALLSLASAGDGQVSAAWVVLMLLLLTLGELYLSPVGLSFVTQVAPPELTSLLMGVWFLSSFFGNYMAGALGARYATMPAGKFWALCFALALVNGGAMAVAARPLKRILSAPLPAVGAADRGAAEGEGEELGTL